MTTPRPVSLVSLVFIGSVAFAAVLGCGDDGEVSPDGAVSPDQGGADGALPDLGAGGEAGPGDMRADGFELPLTLPAGGTGHSDVGTKLGSGAVRAGKVTATSQLLSGIKVEGRVGDFKIYNNKVAFIIQNKRISDGWGPWGAEVLDAQRLDAPGTDGHSLLGEMLFATGVRIMDPVSVGVVSDGSDGKAALVRAIGKPRVVPYLGAIMGDGFGADLDMYIVMDYLLEPDSDALELRWRLISGSGKTQELPMAVYAFQAGDGAEFYHPGRGFDLGTYSKLDYIGMIAQGIGYAMVSLDDPFIPLVAYNGVWVLSGSTVTLKGGAEKTYKMHLLVTRGTPEAVARGVRKIKKSTEPPALSGVVKDPSGNVVAGARVHVRTSDSTASYVTRDTTDASGKYSVGLTAGTYAVTVVADGRRPAKAVSVTMGSAAQTLDLAVEGSGTVAYAVTEKPTGVAQPVPLPAKLVFVPKTAMPSLPAALGEQRHPHGAALVVYSPTGSGKASLPVGEYAVNVSRGFEYEVVKTTVTVTDGATQNLAAQLERSVDTTGYMCGDFHLHAMWSPDSSDLYDFKVSTLVASGVELPVTTDHEYIADFNPAIAKLGVQKWVYGIVGEELTTLVYGHFNPFPIKQDPTKANMGAMIWAHKTPSQLFSDVRKTWPGAVFQVNHPRSVAIGGYFTYVGWDPTTGKALTIPQHWSKDFDAFEVTNGSSWDSNANKTVPDWFSFLDRGFLVTGTGNSDSHQAYFSQVGYPRNYVKLSTDEPAKLSLAEFATAVKAQKVLVSGGPYMTVSVGGKGMGEVADAKGGKADLKVKVQAPTWMNVSKLRIYQGGQVVKTVTLDSTTADPNNKVVRYDDTIALTAAADTHVIVVASGSGSLAPVSNGSPFAYSNPIYLDVDGNGLYDPPKSF